MCVVDGGDPGVAVGSIWLTVDFELDVTGGILDGVSLTLPGNDLPE